MQRKYEKPTCKVYELKLKPKLLQALEVGQPTSSGNVAITPAEDSL